MRIRDYFFLCGCLFLAHCKKDNNATTSGFVSELKTDSTALVFTADLGRIDSFNVLYNSGWSISIEPAGITWIKPSVLAGTGNKKIYVTTQEKNTTGGPRIATLVVKPDVNTIKSVNVAITQLKEKQWEGIAVFPGVAREKGVSFSINGKFFTGLGTGIKNNAQRDLNDFYEYDMASNTWTQIADFPGSARELAVGFSVNNKGYVGLGLRVDCPLPPGACNSTYLYDFWEYDPGSSSWKLVANYTFLSSGAAAVFSFIVNDKAYIGADNKIWEFNSTDYSLNPKSAFPTLVYATAFSIDNKAYIGTGLNFTRDFYEYDPMADTWKKLADFGGEGRYGAIGFSLNGRGYIGAGIGKVTIGPGTSQEVRLKDAWEYDPASNTWIKFFDIPEAIVHGVAAVVNQRALVGTGNAYNTVPIQSKNFWIY